MKKWVLKDEWIVMMFARKGDDKGVRVQVSNVGDQDQELARALARIIELWLRK